MRFWTCAVALFASLALAQQNAINIPGSALDVTAGQPTTITWQNPSSGTVTIKLQQNDNNITPDSGIVLASNIPASAETATFIIDPSKVNTNMYTIEIIDDTDPTNINFSPAFSIQGAQSTAVDTNSSASVTGSSSTSTATGSTTTSTATDSSSSESSSASSTSDSSASSTSESSATQTTSAPSSDNNGAAGLRVQGGLVAAIAVAVAVL